MKNLLFNANPLREKTYSFRDQYRFPFAIYQALFSKSGKLLLCASHMLFAPEEERSLHLPPGSSVYPGKDVFTSTAPGSGTVFSFGEEEQRVNFRKVKTALRIREKDPIWHIDTQGNLFCGEDFVRTRDEEELCHLIYPGNGFSIAALTEEHSEKLERSWSELGLEPFRYTLSFYNSASGNFYANGFLANAIDARKAIFCGNHQVFIWQDGRVYQDDLTAKDKTEIMLREVESVFDVTSDHYGFLQDGHLVIFDRDLVKKKRFRLPPGFRARGLRLEKKNGVLYGSLFENDAYCEDIVLIFTFS